MQLPLAGSSYAVASKATSVQRTINMVPQRIEAGNERAEYTLRDIPGLQNLAWNWIDKTSGLSIAKPTGEVLGQYLSNDGLHLYVVQYELPLTDGGGSVFVGMMRTSQFDDSASLSGSIVIYKVYSFPVYGSNGNKYAFTVEFQETINQIGFSTNGGWYWSLIPGPSGYPAFAALSGVLTPKYNPSFLDNRIFVHDREQISWCDIGDLTTWNVLSFANAESSPDKLQVITSAFGRLWLIGTATTEVWASTGDENIIQRTTSYFADIGCAAPLSVVKNKTALFWVARDKLGGRCVVKTNGGIPQRISDRFIEEKLNKVDDNLKFDYKFNFVQLALPKIADNPDKIVYEAIRAWGFSESGSNFYALTIPGEETTFVYDDTTGVWCERAGLQDGNYVPYLGQWFFSLSKRDFWLDRWGNLYLVRPELNKNIANDTQKDVLVRERIFPVISSPDGKLIKFPSFELMCDRGFGGKCQLSWSDDDGYTWSSWIEIDLGAVGNRKLRCIRRRLGAARQRVFRIRVTDNAPFNPVMAWAETA